MLSVIPIPKYTGNRSVKIYGEQDENKTRKEVYFVFGSHRAFAWSTDLQNWKTFTNNINDDTNVRHFLKRHLNGQKQVTVFIIGQVISGHLMFFGMLIM